MTLNDLKAAFSLAYMRAVAHAAGFFAQGVDRERDGDGVDLTLFSRDSHGLVRSPSVDLQVKATAAPVDCDPIPFDLDAKNYNELCHTGWQVPRILAVVFLPEDQADWVDTSPEQLILRRCGYWLPLRGQQTTTNTTSVRVKLPRTNLVDVASVQSMMGRIRQGGYP